jgi:heterodisulfide reductase subunit B
MVSACPNCQAVYDLYPFLVDKKYRKRETRLPPSIFFTQLLGLSLGFGFEALGFGRHRYRQRLKEILEFSSV